MTSDLILGGTGHRLSVLGGDREQVYGRLIRYATEIIPSYKPSEIVSGMAEGWDQAIVEAAISLGLPFTAAVPFVGQESVWSPASQANYRRMLGLAKRVVIVSPGGFSTQKYHERDKWMVANSTKMLALWNGVKRGGTYATVMYAKAADKEVFNVWPGWENYE